MAGTLTFNRNEVEALLVETENLAEGQSHVALYDMPETARPGLWLVGDHGVYLLSNVTESKTDPAYARECDPQTVDFDDWWYAKEATFGSDDGVEFISADVIRQWIVQNLRVGSDTLTIVFHDDHLEYR